MDACIIKYKLLNTHAYILQNDLIHMRKSPTSCSAAVREKLCSLVDYEISCQQITPMKIARKRENAVVDCVNIHIEIIFKHLSLSHELSEIISALISAIRD